MTETFGLIVTDASPLITLALADSLHTLLMVQTPILIPDMVYAEVAQDIARLGAETIVNFVRENRDRVRIVPTTIFAEYQALVAINPKTRSRGRGEQSALEVLSFEIATDLNLQAILLYEDSDIQNRSFQSAMPERVAAISTGDYLRALEDAGLIQSSDEILDRAALAGRNIEALRQ